MPNSTLLSYEMMWQTSFVTRIMQAEGSGAIKYAALHLQTLAELLDVKDLPPEPLDDSGMIEGNAEWVRYYFKLWKKVAKQLKATIAEVRVRYGKKNKDIPEQLAAATA